MSRQWQRFYWRSAFFALFVLTPLLDWFRLDLTQGHFILFGYPWRLELTAQMSPLLLSWQLFWRAILPVLTVAVLVLWVAWRYGRLYCGWLCPHYSVVELLNALMRRASGKPSVWDKKPLPTRLPDGREIRPQRRWWGVLALAALGFALLWAVTLLTYLLPPAQVYRHLFTGTLTRNEALFIGVATTLLVLEFSVARHLFCRFGCAVGLAQSLAWMGNRRALRIGFDKSRVAACITCQAACDHACPMRLQPRGGRQKIFTCTQCARCLSACETVQQNNPQGSLLVWVKDLEKVSVAPPQVNHRKGAKCAE